MSPSTMMNFRDKGVMKTRLAAAEVPCALHHTVETPEEARDFAAQVGYPLIVKPVAGVRLARSPVQ